MLNSFDRAQIWLQAKYEITILWVLRSPIKTLGIASIVFFLSLFLTAFIPKNFLPTPDNGEFFVRIEKPVGTNLETTELAAIQLEDYLKKHPAVTLLSSVVGGSQGIREPNKAEIYVKLLPRRERSQTTGQVKDEMRKTLATMSLGGNISIADVDAVNSGQKPLNLNLTGENLEELAAYAEKLKNKMSSIQGLADVDTNFRSGKPEFHVDFDRAKAEALGVSTVVAGG